MSATINKLKNDKDESPELASPILRQHQSMVHMMKKPKKPKKISGESLEDIQEYSESNHKEISFMDFEKKRSSKKMVTASHSDIRKVRNFKQRF